MKCTITVMIVDKIFDCRKKNGVIDKFHINGLQLGIHNVRSRRPK